MRCIETMGAKRKLITTNGHIAEYDFYDPNNILIVDRQNPVVPPSFTTSPYRDIPVETYDRYRIDRWLETILEAELRSDPAFRRKTNSPHERGCLQTQTVPLVFSDTIFHRANKAYDKFRYIATSRNTFLRSENGRFSS